MKNRDHEIQDLIDGVSAVVAASEPALRAKGARTDSFFERLRTCGEPPSPQSGEAPPVLAPPVLDLLPAGLATARLGGGAMAALTGALAVLAPRLTWYRRPEATASDFANGHANAHVIGPRGLEAREDVILGLSLLAPNISYPEHRHPPEEVYLVMSDGDWWQGDGPWYTPGFGGLVYNPSNTRHAMRAGAKPLLAMWFLWPK